MNKSDAAKRIQKLREAIDRHRYLYHVLDRQEISEAALDSLKHELWKLEQEWPDLVTPDSPTQRIGGRPLDQFVKVRHRQPMLSIEDVFSLEELTAWRDRLQRLEVGDLGGFFCELKMDGLALSLTYRNGRLVGGATRGDGHVGEDVLSNLKTVESIPLALRRPEPMEVRDFARRHADDLDVKKFSTACAELPPLVEVRGEVFMSKAAFEELNRKQERAELPPFANPRNAAAGTIRQLDPQVVRARRLDFFGYALLAEFGLRTHQQAHELLPLLGVPVNPHSRLAGDLGEVEEYYREFGRRREKLPYWIDGVVVVVNGDRAFSALGVVGKAPRGIAAYKFPAEQATTVVESVRVQVGRTGALTPVAVMRPVRVAGTTVTHATLHNEDEIRRLGLKIGDTVVIEKAGDIIPKVIKVIVEARTGDERQFRMPKACPACGAPAVRRDGEAATYCTNLDCYARSRERLAHYVAKGAADIPGLGERVIERLIDEGLISSAADIYRLQQADLSALEGLGEKSADKLVAAIASRRRLPLARFIYALGIRHVGEETARSLAAHFGNLSGLRAAGLAELSEVPDVGPVVAESVQRYFSDRRLSAELDELLAFVELEDPVASSAGGPLSGKSFVLTGTLTSMTRDAAKDRIRGLGGQISEAVSRATDYLVVGADPGSKLVKAEKLGVKILNERDFSAILMGESRN